MLSEDHQTIIYFCGLCKTVEQALTCNPHPPEFSLGQVVCGEKPSAGFELGATTTTPATLLEPVLSFIMIDLKSRQPAHSIGDDTG